MKYSYEELKIKLHEQSRDVYEKFSCTIAPRKVLGAENMKGVVTQFNDYFELVSQYVDFIINNEVSKINDTILFFQNGFNYMDGTISYDDNDMKEFLSIYLQMLYEAIIEYGFLYTGKVYAFAHQNDVNNKASNMYTKFSRSLKEYTEGQLFNNIKNLKGREKIFNILKPHEHSLDSHTILSYHSVELMYHITDKYLKGKEYKGKLQLKYDAVERIDHKLNEF